MKTLIAVMAGAFAMVGVASVAHAQSKCTSSKMKAAGKKASCLLGLDSKAASKNTAIDTTKVQGCKDKFSAAFAKAEGAGDCIAPTGDTTAIENKTDTATDAINTETAVSPPSKCQGSLLKAAGKKAKCLLGVQAKAASKNLPLDTAKIQGCKDKFSAAATKAAGAGDCGGAASGTQIENDVDDYVDDVVNELTATTTALLSFTVSTGTTSCGAAGLTSPPAAPTAGNVDSDTACTTSVSTLGLGCLYFGGGSATVIPPGAIPDGSTSVLQVNGGGTVTGVDTGNRDTCTVGAGPGTHCVNNNSLPACANDGACGGTAGSCAPDAHCFFGPPLPILSPAPFQALTTCILNVVQTSATGTANAGTGDVTISLPLSSRVYITGNTASPCPECLSGSCDPTWKTATATTSPDTGAACTAVGTKMTSNDCRPNLGGFQAPLPVSLNPLTTGTASKTAGGGSFCPSQNNAGAFGQATTQCITETGQAAGDITDNLPHNAHLVSVFCIPATGNVAVDNTADVPGPGAFSLNGNAQLMP